MTMIASLPEQHERRGAARHWLMVDGWAVPAGSDQRDGFEVTARNVSSDGMMLNCLAHAGTMVKEGRRLRVSLSDPARGGSIDLFGSVAWREPSIWESPSLARQGGSAEVQWRFGVVFEDTPVTVINRLIYRDVGEGPAGGRETPSTN